MGAWPKGITVGNWREGGCAAHSLIHATDHSSSPGGIISRMCVRTIIPERNNL